MADPARARKLADRIKVVVAETLERRVKDPRLGVVTVTDVGVTGDLQNATVVYTVLGEDADLESTAAALASANGLLRREVGKNLNIRLTPTLTFIADSVPAAAAELEELLQNAAEHDAEIARRAESARPVAENPYKTQQRSEEHTSELQSRFELVCRLLLETKKTQEDHRSP